MIVDTEPGQPAAGGGELETQRALEGIDLCLAQRAALGASVKAAMDAR